MNRMLFLSGVFLLIFGLTSFKKPEKKPKPFALIELFTSESCSSCPAADKLLNAITDDPAQEGKTIFVVPLHVDYWNHLQWKDPYSSKEFSDRQYAYNYILHDGVYTPQAIVNGTYPFVGSDKGKLMESIKKASKTIPESSISLQCQPLQIGKPIKISYFINNLPANTVLNFAILKHDIISHVLHGENGGRELHHASATISFTTIKPAANGETQLQATDISGKDKYSLIAYLQDKTTLQVLAAEEVNLTSGE